MRLVITCLVLLVSMGLAQAEKRVALVIGNSNYKLISPLVNPKNDAMLMASTLKGVGFEVVTAIDVDYRAMRRAVRKFGRALRSSGKNAVGLMYYAGHGIQARGANFLVPLGADIQSTADLELEALSASDILAQMEDAGNRLNLVILDACRNNPLPGNVRSAGRGLARIHAASGSLIAFAAAPGQVAFDGQGGNSPYTSALVEAIKEPGLAVEQVFKRVRVSVESRTNGDQTPWEESSLRGDFYFLPKKTEKQPVLAPIIQLDKESVFWNSVKGTGSVELLRLYMARYPNGTFVELAGVMIKSLKSKSEQVRIQKEIKEQNRENELRKQLEAERLARIKAEEERLNFENQQKQQLETLAALTSLDTETVLPQEQSPAEMTLLGRRFEFGDGIKTDLVQAARWYRQAAEKGDPEARYRLGRLYFDGRGVVQDFNQSATQILNAVKSKHRPAYEFLLQSDISRNREFLRNAQRHLKSLGIYRNSVDGIWGQNTKRSIGALFTGQAVTKSKQEPAKPSKSAKATAKPKVSKPNNEFFRINRGAPEFTKKNRGGGATVRCKMWGALNPDLCS